MENEESPRKKPKRRIEITWPPEAKELVESYAKAKGMTLSTFTDFVAQQHVAEKK